MWTESLQSAEGLITAFAMLITAIGGAILAIKNITKHKDSTPVPVAQGQTISASDLWVQDLRKDAAEADQLRDRLTKALIRLAEHGIPYDDI